MLSFIESESDVIPPCLLKPSKDERKTSAYIERSGGILDLTDSQGPEKIFRNLHFVETLYFAHCRLLLKSKLWVRLECAAEVAEANGINPVVCPGAPMPVGAILHVTVRYWCHYSELTSKSCWLRVPNVQPCVSANSSFNPQC